MTVSLIAACGETPINMVLVIDSSSSGSGQLSEDILVWAEDVIDFTLSVIPLARVGVVSYNDGATAQCELTDDEAVLRSCLATIVTGAGRRLDLGLLEAVQMLLRGRPTDPELSLVTQDVALVLMAGPPEPDCAVAIVAAGRLKAEGILTWSVFPCTGCDNSCARRVATSPRYFFTRWEGFLMQFANSTEPLHPHSTVVSTTLGSAMSVAVTYGPQPIQDGQTLTWSFGTPVPNPVTVTYHAYALRAGTYEFGRAGALLRFDGHGNSNGARRVQVAIAPVEIHVTGSLWLPLVAHGR